MSLPAVRAALETAVNGLSPALATAWQNHPYSPVNGTPYQRVTLLPATPDDIEMSGKKYLEVGVMQIDLFYPLDNGAGAAEARAEVVRDTFYRGASFTSGSVTVDITRTPEILPGTPDEDRFMVPVRVRYAAQISRS